MGIFFAWLRARDRARHRPLPLTAPADRCSRRLYVQFLCLAAVGLAGVLFLASNSAASQFVQMDFNISATAGYRSTIFIELFDDRPQTRDNFLAYVNGNRYNNTLVHRFALSSGVPFVLQGGGYHMLGYQDEGAIGYSLYSTPEATVDLDGNPATANPTIPNEFAITPTRSNVKGTIAMAQTPGAPNSATSQWFFNLNNNTGLDASVGGSGPYTVFGKVAGDGMSLIDTYATLGRFNFNEDANNDGIRDAGPFSEVPVLGNGQSILPLILNRARSVNYLGSGVTTTTGTLIKDTFLDTGTVLTGESAVTISAGVTLGVRENYALSHSIVNHGALAPGLQIGAITMPNYAQFNDGTLAIQLRKRTTSQNQVVVDYDQLNVVGAAFLSGQLLVSSVGGTWVANDEFEIVKANSITGTFTSFSLPLLTPGLVWNISRTSTDYTLRVVAADFDKNGIVDAADYAVWRASFGSTSNLAADANGNGRIDTADYVIWRQNLGNIRGTAASGSGSLLAGAVPEPSTLALLIIGVLGMAPSRRHGTGDNSSSTARLLTASSNL